MSGGFALRLLATMALGLALGLYATFASIQQGLGFAAVRVGPWTSWPKAGTADIDPYGRAALARRGELPLGLAEGLVFVAGEDSDGRRLERRCVYAISGAVPRARVWTIAATAPDGSLVAHPAARYALASSELLRRDSGDAEIVASREARPGNWLPVGGDGPFLLALRLYDADMAATASALDADALPRIRRGACA